MQGSYGVLKSMKKVCHFPVWKNFFFGLLVWKQKKIFQTCIFGMHFHNISLNIDFILLPLR